MTTTIRTMKLNKRFQWLLEGLEVDTGLGPELVRLVQSLGPKVNIAPAELTKAYRSGSDVEKAAMEDLYSRRCLECWHNNLKVS
jgi:hypothetical protein